MTTLDCLKPGSQCTISGFAGLEQTPALIDRMQDLGLRVGEKVEVIRRAPLGDPMVFRVCDYELCLRKRDAKLVQVVEGLAHAESPTHVETLSQVDAA